MDEPRQGAPVKFTAEQVVQIMALACEAPQVCGLPISQWSGREERNRSSQTRHC